MELELGADFKEIEFILTFIFISILLLYT